MMKNEQTNTHLNKLSSFWKFFLILVFPSEKSKQISEGVFDFHGNTGNTRHINHELDEVRKTKRRLQWSLMCFLQKDWETKGCWATKRRKHTREPVKNTEWKRRRRSRNIVKSKIDATKQALLQSNDLLIFRFINSIFTTLHTSGGSSPLRTQRARWDYPFGGEVPKSFLVRTSRWRGSHEDWWGTQPNPSSSWRPSSWRDELGRSSRWGHHRPERQG